MKSKKIRVVSHRIYWKFAFLIIASRIEKVVPLTIGKIHHVGSTSVEGLPSKPIVDIDIEIYQQQEFPEVAMRLIKLGYQHVGDLGIKGREVFKLKRWNLLPKHHLYVCVSGSSELNRQIAFRNYLIANPKTKEAYGKLKIEAAKKHPYDMDAYLKMKGELINKVYRELGLD